MAFHDFNELRYYAFDILSAEPVAQGIFTRLGGVSPAPWHSLNTGGMNGDPRDNVIENRRRIFATFDRPVDTIFDVWQVHSARVLTTKSPRPLEQPHQKADAIITDSPDVTLFMRFGDCVPIYLFDSIRRVTAIAHAGWQGTVSKIVQATIRTMAGAYGCQPANILVGIGPSICFEHYEFGGEPLKQVQDAFGEDASEVISQLHGKQHFDLWKANQILCLQAGIKAEHIQISGVCTASNTGEWYSHRAEHGKTGRFGALLGLK